MQKKVFFLERLTDEQIIEFIERRYPKEKGYEFALLKSQGYIYVKVNENKEDSSNIFSLYTYESIGFDRPNSWIKYLYEIFGEEYKQAYLNECAKIFN